MGTAHAGDSATGALLPLTLQNTYRARYRAMRPGWQSSGDQLEALVRGYVSSETSVLDLGCGRGGVVELFWRGVKFAAGLDPDIPSLSEHRAPGMPVLRAVGEHLPFAADSFDLVVSVWVLEHVKEPLQVLREVARVLRVAELRVVPDPTYLALNGLMFRTSVFAERLMPKGWGVHLLGDLTRR